MGWLDGRSKEQTRGLFLVWGEDDRTKARRKAKEKERAAAKRREKERERIRAKRRAQR